MYFVLFEKEKGFDYPEKVNKLNLLLFKFFLIAHFLKPIELFL